MHSVLLPTVEQAMILFRKEEKEKSGVQWSGRRYLAIPFASIDIAASDVFPNFSVPQVKVSRCAEMGAGPWVSLAR